MSPLDAHFAGLDILNRQVAVIGKLEQEVGRLERELAAIRQAFPEDHPARKEGSIADGVRELVGLLRKAAPHVEYSVYQKADKVHREITAALGTPEGNPKS